VSKLLERIDNKNKSDKIIPTDKFTIINNDIINKTIEKKKQYYQTLRVRQRKKVF